jgi:hypothetical protein
MCVYIYIRVHAYMCVCLYLFHLSSFFTDTSSDDGRDRLMTRMYAIEGESFKLEADLEAALEQGDTAAGRWGGECLYTHTHIYIYIHVHVYIHVYTYIYICIYVCMSRNEPYRSRNEPYYIYTYIYTYIYIYIYIYICVCVCVYTCVCVCVCLIYIYIMMCIYIHIYTYIYIYISIYIHVHVCLCLCECVCVCASVCVSLSPLPPFLLFCWRYELICLPTFVLSFLPHFLLLASWPHSFFLLIRTHTYTHSGGNIDCKIEGKGRLGGCTSGVIADTRTCH